MQTRSHYFLIILIKSHLVIWNAGLVTTAYIAVYKSFFVL